MKQTDVMAAIMKAIDTGKEGYHFGDRLPGTRVLAAELGTTQSTVATALTVLAGLGLVSTQDRAQATVTSREPSTINLGRYRSANTTIATGTTAWARDNGGATVETPAEVRHIVAADADADTGIPVGTDVVERSRTRSIDGVPVQHKRTLLTHEAAALKPPGWTGLPPMMTPADVAPPDGQSIAEWLGMGVTNVAYMISIDPASKPAAQALGFPEKTPALRIVSRGLREDGSTAYATVTTASTRSRIGLEIGF